MLIFLNLLHTFAFRGSAGQGAFLLFHIKYPLRAIKNPEIKNKIPLYFESITRKGRVDTSPANTAPAPNATRSAGKAQHKRVPRLVKRLKDGSMRFLVDTSFIKYFY